MHVIGVVCESATSIEDMIRLLNQFLARIYATVSRNKNEAGMQVLKISANPDFI
jgi:spore maturation protein SpmA